MNMVCSHQLPYKRIAYSVIYDVWYLTEVKIILYTWTSFTLPLNLFGLAVYFFAPNKWWEAALAGFFDLKQFDNLQTVIDGAISCTKILSFVDCICHLSGKLVVLYSLGVFIWPSSVFWCSFTLLERVFFHILVQLCLFNFFTKVQNTKIIARK